MKKIISFIIAVVLSAVAYSQCNTCGGRGYLEQSTKCTSCNYGYVESTLTRDCTTCYGRGSVPVTCSECGGQGTKYKNISRICPECKGANKVTKDVFQGQCPSCKGSGQNQYPNLTPGTECPRCGGKGGIYKKETVHCFNCVNGYVTKTEQVSCDKCGGKRTVQETCPTCHGQRHYTERTTTQCTVCGGTGSKTIKNTCPTCHGGFH